MLKNYFTIAWRNLMKSKGYSAINIGGLAVGMAVAMLIAFWIYDETHFNHYHKNYPEVGQIMQKQTFNGYRSTGNAIPIPLVDEIKAKYGREFKYLVMTTWQGGRILSIGDKKLTVEGNFMDVDVADMLSLEMVKGSSRGLQELHSIFLSQSVAKAFFGNEDPLNKLMKIDNRTDVKVTGVYKDIPANSEFRDLKFISPWELYVSTEDWVRRAKAESQWGNNSFQLFAQLQPGADVRKVNALIRNVKFDRVPADEKRFKAEIFIHPMADWRLHSRWDNGVRAGGLIQYVWLFGVVGIFVLLLACINFMNLSTARSEKRAREVGIRKAVGSARWQIIRQFFGESLFVVVIAFFGAVLFVNLLLPWFNQVTAKQMTFPVGEPLFWGLSILFIAVTAVLAGIYPALYLSSFQPVKVLKGTFKAGKFAAVPRKVLVVVQFTVSVALIIGTILVYQQIQHTKNRPLGYDNDGIVMINLNTPEFKGKYDLFRTELKRSGAIIEMSESSSPLTGVWSNNGGWNWQGKDPALDAEFSTIWVTTEHGKTVGWQFTAGRDFSRDFGTDSLGLVINEAAVKFMNIREPVGMQLDWDDKKFTIIGVIKDMLMESPYEPVRQAIYLNATEDLNWMNLKLNPAQPVRKSLAAIEDLMKRVVPSAPFDYEFADEAFGKKFESEERVSKLTAFFAILAIFISCLGLFGLASFVAEQRTKEIGIRKVIGASLFSVWKLLSIEFVLLVGLSCIIAIPISYYYMRGWLDNYKYRTDISWLVFAIAATAALIITLLTISFQAIKVGMRNPIRSLRTE